MLKFLFSFFLIGLTLTIHSQKSDLKFDYIGTNEGLSTSWVRAIYEDKSGFIWIGTSDGLNRYDGYNCRVYRSDEDNDINGLVDNAIRFFMDLNEDELLICTEQGVSIFEFETEKFRSISDLDNVRVTSAVKDGDGNIWFSSNSGLYYYNPSDSVMLNYKHDLNNKFSIAHNQSELCYIDSDNTIWIATQNGLDRFDREQGKFYHYLNQTETEDQYRVSSVIEDDKGRLWIGSTNKGLCLLLFGSDTLMNGSVLHVTNGSVNCLTIDDNNILWIGNILGQGIQRLDLNNFEISEKPLIQTTKGIPGKFMSLSDNSVTTIFQDHNKSMWIGTFAGGVNYFNPMMKQFQVEHHMPGDPESLSNNVVNCFADDDQYLWIGTEEGFCRLNKDNNKFTNYFFNPNDYRSIGANGVLSILKDSRGNIWAGTWSGGLNRFNRRTGDFTRYLSDHRKQGTISSNNVVALYEDSKGNLWVGTDGGGLNRFDYTKGTFTAYMPETENASSIYHNAVNDICETADGRLFLSVYHSLELFDYKTGKFTHYVHDKEDTNSIGSGLIIDIFEDSNKNLWIATSSGLNLFDPKKESFRRFSHIHGLPGNAVQSIIEDSRGNIWLGTNNGLSKFIHGTQLPEVPVFINYTVDDGLHANEFVRRSAFKSNDGEFFFGGTDGYIRFHPDSIIENQIPPEVVLSGFDLIGESEKKYRIQDILGKEVNHIEKIELSYDQTDFVIHFAALNYLNPQKNKYTYILEGYEKEWHKVSSERTATYTNIHSGKYTFRVRGSNNDGVWSSNDKSVHIIIHPAWWGSLGFKFFAGLVILALIYVIIRIRVQTYRNQKKLLEDMVKERTTELSELNAILEEKQEEISLQNEELTKHRLNLEKLVDDRTEAMKHALKRAEEADRLKSAFLANMSHEIRTPMNAIVGFATLLTNDELKIEERKEYLEIINNNSETLMVLINDILEISLIEANQLRLKRSTFNVTAILEELDSYYRLRNRKNIDLEFVNKEDELDLFLHSDQIRFRQIFTNLLNNAFKYTDSGKISFGYDMNTDNVKFFVTDTGIGIAESEYDNIFNYFHKIDKGDNKLYRGAGIGLSISNKLVELMGGKIWLDSAIGKGTSFYFTLPPGKAKDEVIEYETTNKEKKNSLKGVTILVAEDETTNFRLIEKILKPTDAKIIWAENGKVAIEKVDKLESTKNCVVLMDIKMPLLNGINATKIIKRSHPELPVIAVTAFAQAKDKDQILKQNFIDYIPKPLNQDQLLLKIYKYAFINQDQAHQ